MRVRDIMTHEVATCRPHTSLAALADIMWRNDCGIVPVIDGERRVLGVVTDRDACIAAGTRERCSSELRADEVMSRRLHTCGPDDDVSIAIDAMTAARVRRLPVVECDGRLVGILSVNDLIVRAKPETRDAHGIGFAQVMGLLRAICQSESGVKSARAAASALASPARV